VNISREFAISKSRQKNDSGYVGKRSSFGEVLISSGDQAPQQRYQLASTNNANGGIGVSYSNVVLAGGLNPREGGTVQSNYKAAFDQGQKQVPQNYARGLDFNARVKYDYNIVNG